jgi:hypothetical protein
MRRLDQPVTALAGTDGATIHFSPEGHSIGFTAVSS